MADKRGTDYIPGLEPPPKAVGPIEKALLEGNDLEAINAIMLKCARTMDETNSARDIKSLSLTLLDGIMKRRELGGGRDPDANDERRNPLELISFERARRVAGA